MDGPSNEVPLTGGNVGQGVVRVGDTVRRPSGFWSLSVHDFLLHLESVGFDGAPRSLGFDEQGRHVVEYVPGEVPHPFEPANHLRATRRVGALLRDFHDASAEYVPPAEARWNVVIPPDAEPLIIHHDAAPWNLVCGGGRWVIIDWDTAGPGSRLWDLAYAAHGFVPLAPDMDPGVAAGRLHALAEGYGLDESGRRDLAVLLGRRVRSMYDLLADGHRTGTEPWNRLWNEGHGRAWLADAEYVEDHLDVLTSRLLEQ